MSVCLYARACTYVSQLNLFIIVDAVQSQPELLLIFRLIFAAHKFLRHDGMDLIKNV
jgi:hypothetical protein